MENSEEKELEIDKELDELQNEIDKYEHRELNSGIKAIDMAYLFDDRAEKLVDPFKKSVDYIKKHTDLSEDEIINCINNAIYQIEIKEGYQDNPIGVGYVDGIFKILSLDLNVLKEEPEYTYRFIRHEMTHMIGNQILKLLFKKNPILVSGYSRENAYDEKVKTKFEAFNESAVEMFVSQDDEYREEKVFDYTINTNQDLNGGLYALNSNLIHQMLIARGIEKEEFFKGLYDYKKSKQVIGKFKRATFKKLTLNMDNLCKKINDYYDADDEIYKLQKDDENIDVGELEEKKKNYKTELEGIVSSSERMIIDKILLPRLKKVPLNERQGILDEYYKFIISERDYFRTKTMYRAVADFGTQESPWLRHIDVEPIDIEKLSRDNRQNVKGERSK